jgi:hypothetical protein
LNYARIYESLIRKAIRTKLPLGIYSEVHHIIPRSLGGGDDKENLVALSYREHFLAHWLLTKMFSGKEKRKMVFAFHAMSLQLSQRRITSWQFEAIKRNLKEQGLETRRKRLAFKIEQRDQKVYDKIKDLVSRPEHKLSASELISLANLKRRHANPRYVRKGRHYKDRYHHLLYPKA